MQISYSLSINFPFHLFLSPQKNTYSFRKKTREKSSKDSERLINKFFIAFYSTTKNQQAQKYNSFKQKEKRNKKVGEANLCLRKN